MTRDPFTLFSFPHFDFRTMASRRIFAMRYRRAKTPDGAYFLTVVTFRGRKFLCEPDNLELLLLKLVLRDYLT